MFTWEDVIKKYIVRYQDEISKVTKPLHDLFDIGYFTYHKVDNEGRYTVLVDRPDYADFYVKEKVFEMDPFLRHPDNFSSTTTFFEFHGEDIWRDKILTKAFNKFGMDHGVVRIEKSDDCVEFFGFCGHHKSLALHDLYLNKSHLMETFAKHFKTALSKQLQQMEEEPIFLPHLKGEDFFKEEPLIQDNTLFEFLKSMGYTKELHQYSLLTPRELECLSLIRGGKTAKESASSLKIGYRTVESYTENIKNKLHCHTKSDLIHLANRWHTLGILP